jgi:uncharacterized protein YndB with AHSA1/START domain
MIEAITQGKSEMDQTEVPIAVRDLTITRVFDAPRAAVFRAWTEPELIARWWGPQGFTTTAYDIDVRPGGVFRLSMRSPEGTEHRKIGTYREIVAPERLVFSFAWEDEDGNPGHETIVTVRLAALGAKTRLTLHQEIFASVAARDDHRAGWTSCLERFASFILTGILTATEGTAR